MRQSKPAVGWGMGLGGVGGVEKKAEGCRRKEEYHRIRWLGETRSCVKASHCMRDRRDHDVFKEYLEMVD